MHIIDKYAYNNRLRFVDPAEKAILVFVVLLLCLLLNTPLVGVLAVLWMWVLAVWLAKIPFPVLGKILLTEFSFFVLATMGVALSVTFGSPLSVNPWAIKLGPLWFSSSPVLLNTALLILTRVMGGVAAMNFLTLTTPLVDLIELSRRWHVPGILVDLTVLMYRFIFVLLGSLEVMRKAQQSRLGYNTTYWRAMNSAALLGSRLFIETFQRSRVLQTALESRGYEGGMFQVLAMDYEIDYRLIRIGWGIVASLFLAWWLI